MSETELMTVSEETLDAGRAMQRVQGSYSTAVAVQKPRRLPEVERRLIDEAGMAGEGFYYGWGAGKNKIEGPSQELAFCAARCWGNCAIEQENVQELPDAWMFTCSFVDLETGFTVSRQFRQSKKWTIYGKFDTERKDDIRFQIGQSKAARNVILKALPGWLIDKAMEHAKAGVRAKLDKYIEEKGLPAAIDLLVRALGKHGVKTEAIASKFGIAEVRALDVEQLITLRGDVTALDKGQARASELFPADDPDPAGDSLKEEAERLRASDKPEPEVDLEKESATLRDHLLARLPRVRTDEGIAKISAEAIEHEASGALFPADREIIGTACDERQKELTLRTDTS